MFPWSEYRVYRDGFDVVLREDTPKEVVEKYKLYRKIIDGILSADANEIKKISKGLMGDIEFWVA